LPVFRSLKLQPADGVHRIHAVDRTPEVVIKVVSPGSNSLDAVRIHLETMGRGKHRALEDDQGEPVPGKTAVDRLLDDWNLDLDELYWRQPYLVPARRKPPKLVHKLLFSMPAGTPPEKLLLAVRHFVRAEFADHRYALGLHTDDPHPHVHVIVKAFSEQGGRLNIRKPMLRAWRQEFARCLRSQGIPAKASPRSARRRGRPPLRGPVPSSKVA
jgi:hypothetical protein